MLLSLLLVALGMAAVPPIYHPEYKSCDGGRYYQKARFLNAMKGCTHIKGDILIYRVDDLLNLDIMKGIQQIDGFLSIEDNLKLQNIDGLTDLKQIGGYMNIRYNPELISVDGLGSVDTIGGWLGITENPKVPNLHALHRIGHIEGHATIESPVYKCPNFIAEDTNVRNKLTIQKLYGYYCHPSKEEEPYTFTADNAGNYVSAHMGHKYSQVKGELSAINTKGRRLRGQ
jgi:hypothetical protein